MAALLNVYYGKSAALAFILSQEAPKQLAASVYYKWGTTPHKLAFPVQATKTLVMGRKRGDSNFVQMCSRNQSTTELNQKLTKHSQKMLDMGRLHGGKVPMWGLKRGEGVCLKGAYFRELTV